MTNEISKSEFYREKLQDETLEDRLMEQRSNPNPRFCRLCGKEILPVQADFGVVYPNICGVCGTVQ